MKENPDCCKKMKWGWMIFLSTTDQPYDASLFFRHFRRKVRDWSRHQSESQHQVLDPTETHLHRLGPPLCLWPGGGEKPQWVELWWGGAGLYSCPVLLGMVVLCLLGHAIFKLTYLSNHDYKPLYFESDAATVNEIVLKVSLIGFILRQNIYTTLISWPF